MGGKCPKECGTRQSSTRERVAESMILTIGLKVVYARSNKSGRIREFYHMDATDLFKRYILVAVIW